MQGRRDSESSKESNSPYTAPQAPAVALSRSGPGDESHLAGQARLSGHGGGVSRQLDGSGVTVSLFGTLHQGIAADTTPALSGAEVAALLEVMRGGEFVADRQPPLSILPRPDGSYVLAYQVAMSNGHFYFVGAANGKLLVLLQGSVVDFLQLSNSLATHDSNWIS